MIRGIGGYGISEIQDAGIGGTLSPSEALSPDWDRCHPGGIRGSGISEIQDSVYRRDPQPQ